MAKSSAPSGYEITLNALWQKMQTLYGLYKDVGLGKYHSMLVVGPPGIGKSFGADEYIAAGGARLVRVSPDAQQMYDTLFKYRHKHIVLVFDDVDWIWNSERTMSILKIVANARAPREIADPRKGQGIGHGRFMVNCRFVFITNKPILDQGLMAFDKAMREHIEALKSRFQLPVPLSFDPLDCFHFACWMSTDGKHLLRDAVRYEGRSLSIDASNEALAWFASNFNRLHEVSPRVLVDHIASYRLKSPDVWESLAERWCSPEPRQIGTGKFDKSSKEIMESLKNPDPWVIHAPGKTQVLVEPVAQHAIRQQTLTQDKIAITIRRTGRGVHPVHASVFADMWEDEVQDAKNAASNRAPLHNAFRSLAGDNAASRADAALVIAAFFAAKRLNEADMEKHGVADIAIEPQVAKEA